MTNVAFYLACAAGVAISVLLPILRQSLPRPSGTTAGVDAFLPRFWRVAKPYFILGLFSLLVAIVLMVWQPEGFNDYRTAFLAGYLFDSTLQKIVPRDR